MATLAWVSHKQSVCLSAEATVWQAKSGHSFGHSKAKTTVFSLGANGSNLKLELGMGDTGIEPVTISL